MAELAVALILDREPEPSHHVFRTRLIIRQSCGCNPSPSGNPADSPP